MSQQEWVVESDELSHLVDRLAQAILENHPTLEDVVLVGILSTGYPVAKRLQVWFQRQCGKQIPVGKLDVSLYRDDLNRRESFVTLKESVIPTSLTQKNVIIIDDVLFTGRTVRAALNALLDFGRPSRIELGVLIDRGHQELPIFAHYVGKKWMTNHVDDRICVQLIEIDGQDGVQVVQDGRAA